MVALTYSDGRHHFSAQADCVGDAVAAIRALREDMGLDRRQPQALREIHQATARIIEAIEELEPSVKD